MHRQAVRALTLGLVLALAAAGLAVAQGGKTTIRLATWAGVTEANELQEILDRLNARSDTYHIVQESNPAEYQTKLLTSLAAGTAADLFWISQDDFPQLAARGQLLDITDRLAQDPHPAAQVEDYFPSALERYTWNGRIQGLPWISQPVMLFANQDLFDAAGLAYPGEDWTWDTFLATARKLTVDRSGLNAGESGFRAADTVQWGFTLNGWPPIQMFIWQAGGEELSADLRSSPVDTPEAIRGAQFYADLLHRYRVTPPLSVIRDRGFDTMYRNQQVAMFMGGAADDLDMPSRVSFRSRAFLAPKGPAGNRATFAWIGGMAINARTPHPDVAYEAFRDLTDAIHHWKIVPPRASLATLERMAEINPEKVHSFPHVAAAMADARAYRIFPNYAEWADIFWNQYVDPLLNGRGTAEQLAPRVRPLLERTLLR